MEVDGDDEAIGDDGVHAVSLDPEATVGMSPLDPFLVDDGEALNMSLIDDEGVAGGDRFGDEGDADIVFIVKLVGDGGFVDGCRRQFPASFSGQ